MNKEKINDFVNIWAQTVGLTESRYINFIKKDIARRCAMYESTISSINVKDNDCDAYIIKPIDGKYSLEDFFLNRLMLGLREISFSGALEGNGGEYSADQKSLAVDVDKIKSTILDKAIRHPALQGKHTQIIQKTIEHELGHCLKSAFTNGYKAPIGSGREQDVIYENLINNLLRFQNGKYAHQIKTIQELNHDGDSSPIKTGVHDSYSIYDYRLEYVDELLNETESLELTNSNVPHEIKRLRDNNGNDSPTGNYVNVYNYISGYSTITGYGSILKSLLGKSDTFHAEYISSPDIFKKFDLEYADIVQDVWGLDPSKFSPVKSISIDFYDLVLKKRFDETTMLKLDEFFAKCYERKIEKSISQSGGSLSQEFIDTTLEEIKQFQERLTTNDDPQKREQLAHNIVFNNIRTRISELVLQNSTSTSHPKNIQPQPQAQQSNNDQMKFATGLIQAYDATEQKYQYNVRANHSLSDIIRLREILETNGLNKTLLLDTEGTLLGRPGDADFKVQYSQKQVSAMARLLKTAKLMTDSSKLNPEDTNYLEQFVNIPEVNYRLQQMHADFKDESSYIYELRQNAKNNRSTGNIPSYPPTQAEIDARNPVEPTVHLQRKNILDFIYLGKPTPSDLQKQTNLLRMQKLLRMKNQGLPLTDNERIAVEQYEQQQNEAKARRQQHQQSIQQSR